MFPCSAVEPGPSQVQFTNDGFFGGATLSIPPRANDYDEMNQKLFVFLDKLVADYQAG